MHFTARVPSLVVLAPASLFSLAANLGSGADLLVAAAVEGSGIIYLYEEMLRPNLESGALKPLLERWWLRFAGPFLYYPSRRHMPPALRAFVDFLQKRRAREDEGRRRGPPS